MTKISAKILTIPDHRIIGNIIIFLFINVVNFSFLYFPIKYSSVRYVEFIYFLVISFFLLLIPIVFFYKKIGRKYNIDIIYSSLFFSMLLLIIPGVFWVSQSIVMGFNSLNYELSFIFFAASYSLYFNLSIIGLGKAFLPKISNFDMTFKSKIRLLLLLFIPLLLLSSIYFPYYLFNG